MEDVYPALKGGNIKGNKKSAFLIPKESAFAILRSSKT